MEVTALNQGLYAVTPQKEFTPLPKSQRLEKQPGNLHFAICPFLVKTNTEFVLLDAGFGQSPIGIPAVVSLLDEIGVAPNQVSKILLSHLHKDHIDGVACFIDGKLKPNFPNANIYLQERELEFALSQTQNPSYDQKMLKELSHLPNLILMTDDEGMIGSDIIFEVTGGHSPFHQVFWLSDGEQTVFYGADNLPKKSYWQSRFAYKTDSDGRKALELRQQWAKLAPSKHWTVLFYHDTDNNIVKY